MDKTEINTILDGVKGLIEESVSPIYEQLEELRAGQRRLESSVGKVENNVVKIELTIENEIKPNIQLLAEGHGDNVRKIDEIHTSVQKLTSDVEKVSLKQVK